MVKKRLIATLIVKNGIVVQSINFQKYLPVGKVDVAVEFLNSWGVDEIIIIDIDVTAQNLPLKLDMFKSASKKSFVPLCLGGGIKTIQHIRDLVHHGADKVCINSEAIANPDFIAEAAHVFGSQCIVVCLDIKKDAKNDYRLCFNNEITSLDPIEHALKMQLLGAGEVLINNIDRDGMKNGYDIELIQKISGSLSIPVIALGGVGRPGHFEEAIEKCDVSALAAANFFHFFEHSVTITKSYLHKKHASQLRLDSYFDYKGFKYDESQRLLKRSDEDLSAMLFEFHDKEVI